MALPFDSALNTAILGKKGRSVDAVRALLDLDALKGSKDRTTDINKALEDAVKANPWAFGEQPALHSRVPAPTPPAANTATPCTAVTIPTRWRPPLKT